MGSKDKARRRNKRKQKMALKATRRQKSKHQMLARQRHQNHEVTEAQFPDDRMVFWICHGINYLVSDYDTGVWSPLFEGIYEGNLPAPEAIAQMVLSKYGEDTETWPLEGKAAVAWSLQGRGTLHTYFRKVVHHIRDKDPDCSDAPDRATKPHNAQVWELFNMIKQTITRTAS